jgi:hypothetical protein
VCDIKIKYSFKTKIKYFEKRFSDDHFFPPDIKLKFIKKFYRPYFSNKFDAWEIDFMMSGKIIDEFTKDIYKNECLIFTNINTKYLKIYPQNINKNINTKFITNYFNNIKKK